MAWVIITIKVMPESPDINFNKIKEKAVQVISDFGGKVSKDEIEPIAFGLKALNITYAVDEKKGSNDPVEDGIREIEGVQSAEIINVGRALG